jgi:PAP2 superfamily
MQRSLNRLLFFIALAPVVLDTAWIATGHFAIDAHLYAVVAVLVLPLALAALYYDYRRNEACLSATAAVAAFLIVFPASASLLSYLLLTIAGPRIDNLLASADLALGFHWLQVMAFAADHPRVNALLGFAYMSVMAQTIFLLFVLGLRGRLEALYGFALALAIGAVITLTVWTAFPSFGAFSVFMLPDSVAGKLGVVLGTDYGRILVGMLRNGPGFISPAELRGLVGFPSYHTLQAIVLFWYARREPYLRGVALVLNLVVLVAIPVQGGHHLMDMLGGALVAVAAIAISGSLVSRAKSAARVHRQRWPMWSPAATAAADATHRGT